jgi:cellulose synthase/poly-beta-1,6-N-acetylglucosamine synthase-like glycosyltransferase
MPNFVSHITLQIVNLMMNAAIDAQSGPLLSALDPKTNPLVTIAVPVFNGERTLCAAVESILAQTYGNLEVILCDNASTDRTEQLCRKYASYDTRVRYHRNVENIGQTRNFRRALELSTGEYFTWTCADDVRPACAVEHLAKALREHPASVMAHGPVIAKGNNFEVHVSNRMNLLSSSAANRIRTFTKNIRHNSMIHGLYRRNALKNVVLGPHYGQDYLFCLQVCLMGPVEYVEQPMIIFSERGSEPSIGAMGRQDPLTLLDMLKGRGTKGKCLTVLEMGVRYFLRQPQLPLRERITAVLAHLSAFGRMYPSSLLMDVVSMLLNPLRGRPQWPGS